MTDDVEAALERLRGDWPIIERHIAEQAREIARLRDALADADQALQIMVAGDARRLPPRPPGKPYA